MRQGPGNRMARAAGPFLVSIGATLLAALAAADTPGVPADLNVFLCGTGLSFAILFAGARLSRLPQPAPVQRVAIAGSIALELALFALRPHITGPLSPAGMWIAALMIVGIHFVPFAIALGVELALLGLCCVANAALAMTGWAPPPVWIGIDALLKIGFGLWIWFRPRARTTVLVQA